MNTALIASAATARVDQGIATAAEILKDATSAFVKLSRIIKREFDAERCTIIPGFDENESGIVWMLAHFAAILVAAQMANNHDAKGGGD